MYNPIHILAVEDDEVDAEFLQRTLQQQRIAYQLTVVADGDQAIRYLQDQVEKLLLPHLILLDLNLPGMDGITFLRALRQDPSLQHVLVFILTTSNLASDKVAAYQFGAAGYIHKVNVHPFVQWLNTYCTLVEFPPR